MIEFRTLGTVALTDASDGRELRSVLAQPKRLALLAYLALASPRGLHRRDTLLGLFWPESDDKHARHALSQALHLLRRGLGHAVVVRRGNDEVGLDFERVRCDAVAFRDALARGDCERALELYGGELLPGFYLSDCPEFERWLEGERADLRGAAVRAAWTLAEAAEAEGRAVDAARWARRAVQGEPLDESALRRLLALLQRVGDVPGALTEYDGFRRRLAQELELEPAAETQALVERIRESAGISATDAEGAADAPSEREEAVTPAAQEEPAPDAAEVGEPSPEGPLPAGAGQRSDATVAATEPAVSWRRRPSVVGRNTLLAVSLVLIGFALRAGTAGGTGEPTRPAPLDSSRFAVFPFAVHGTPGDSAALREGLMDLLGLKLGSAPGLSDVDPRVLLSDTTLVAAERVDLEEARRIAERHGAGYFLLGSAFAEGERLAIRASLYPTSGSDQPVGRGVVTGRPERLLELVDALAAQLLAGEVSPAAVRLTRIASVTTESHEALAAYLEGERLFRWAMRATLPERLERMRDVMDAFDRAVVADSSFALAHYRLAIAAGWVQEWERRDHALRRASRNDERLPEPYRVLVSGFLALESGDAGRAEAEFRRVLDIRPDEVQAWFGLALTLLQLNPFRGRSRLEAEEPFTRLLEQDPYDVGTLTGLANLAAARGEFDRVESLVRRVYPPPVPIWDPLLRLSRGDPEAGEAAFRTFEPQAPLHDAAVAFYGAVYLGDMRVLRRFATRAAETATERRWKVHAFHALALLELGSGRPRAAAAALSRADSVGSTAVPEFASRFALHPFLPGAEQSLVRVRTELLDSCVDCPYSDRFLDRAQTTLRPLARPFLLGLIAARLGEREEALRHVDLLVKVPAEPVERALARDLARTVRAELALERGDSAVALALLEGAELRVPLSRIGSPLAVQSHARFRRAELLSAAGRLREAIGWYIGWTEFGDIPFELPYVAPAHLRLAEIHDALGERDRAVHHYARFVRMWQDAEPELRPVVERAAARLAELRGARP